MINTCIFGDCRDTMRDLIAEGVKVNCIVTSPPYWSLRDYKIPPSVWGGDSKCEHRWGDEVPGSNRGGSGTPTAKNGRGEDYGRDAGRGQWCQWCHAWRGCLGLEPTPSMFVRNMVDVFDVARELLTDDGVAWVNMGDSYSSSSTYNTTNSMHTQAGWKQDVERRPNCRAGGAGAGMKPKDMCLIPDRLGIALQESGWWVRSKLPWIKRNGMPESTTDRPAQSVEYVFMLTKRARYFYDHEAVKVKSSPATHERLSQANLENQSGNVRGNGGMKHNGPMKAVGTVPRKLAVAGDGIKNNDSMDEALSVMPSQRNFRVTDLFFQSWQGLWTDDDGEPLALIVNTKGFKDAHFATYPAGLIRPLILASTSAHGHCSKCGAGWARVTTKGKPDIAHQQACGGNVEGEYHGEAVKDYAGTGAQDASEVKARILEGMRESITTGWAPTCKCAMEPVPAVVFDPFIGSGTTGQVAQQLGRNWIGCDMNESYAPMQQNRTRQMGLVV